MKKFRAVVEIEFYADFEENEDGEFDTEALYDAAKESVKQNGFSFISLESEDEEE